MGRERLWLLILFLSLCLVAMLAQDAPPKTAEPKGKASIPKPTLAPDQVRKQPKRPVELVNLIDDVRASVPELAVDSLLKLVEKDIVQERAWKLELLEEAFRLASTVAHKFKLHSTVGNVDTRPGFLSGAYDLNFDALSLKCRTIRAVLPLDRKTGREWFDEIAHFQLPALTCEDLMIYDVAAFYETLPVLLQQGLSEEERRRREDLFLLQAAINHFSNPTEIRPLLKALMSLNLPAADVQQLLPSLNKILLNMSGDPRSFDW